MLSMEEHLSTCELCAGESREIFETLVDLDSWSPESMGEAVRREALVAGLTQAEEDEPAGSEWTKRLKRWRNGVTRAADGGIELIVATSGVRIVTQSLREFIAPGGIRFETLQADRAMVGHSFDAPARQDGLQVAEVLSVEKPEVRVSVSKGNQVSVDLQYWPADRLPPGIVVIDIVGRQRPLRLELRPVSSGRLRTEFSASPGEFMILFAPVEKRCKSERNA
jgi:hypothetical protein